MDGSNTGANNLLFVGGSLALLFCLWYGSSYCFRQDPNTTHDGYVEQNMMEIIPTLKRGDIEDMLHETERWECSVCAFGNVMARTTCSLCGTKKDCKFVEENQEIDYASSSTTEYQNGQANTLVGERQRRMNNSGTNQNASLLPRLDSLSKISSSYYMKQMSSYFFNIVLPEDLNARQRSARMRKEWSRGLDTNGRPYWKRHCLDARHVPAAYLIQMGGTLKNQSPQEDKSGRILQSLPTLREEIDVLEDADTQRENRISILDDLEIGGIVQDIVYAPLEMIDATQTVTGKTLPLYLWSTLQSLSRRSFSVKYAWFLHQVADLLVPYSTGYLKMRTKRDNVLHEAMENLLSLADQSLCSIIRVEFEGESGVDAGAVQREWYMVVSQVLMHEDSGLFVLSNREDSSYILNPNSEYAVGQNSMDHLLAFEAAGRFMGRAILDGIVLQLPFCPVVFKALLGIPMTMDDIESLDRTLYKSLRYLLENDNAEDLALTFSVSELRGTQVIEIDIIEDGKNVAVTDGNKQEYVETLVRYLLFERVKPQLHAMMRGLYDIIPPELLIPFDHKEFELVVTGLSEIDLADWEANTEVSNNLEGAQVLKWFWEVVGELSSDEQAKLLQYCTGSGRVPVQGFKGLTSYDGRICNFTLKGIPYISGTYPIAHACFNRLDLPLYPRKELLNEAIAMLLLSDPTGFNIQ
ncbi:HECT E3 ubiquitin ligase [Thraustotheca clavata]|uniref:HECT-type E3 ubiquitin transferase n=1 Tax=Thraustotheca clavata TaxID=74557 RepID=A0A1W0A0U3_9STRA|nr:HECT E3 ubiquitin ligase [Thraustotheca clavata]